MASPDLARILRASQVRVGTFRVRGAPAIFLGAAAVVLAVGSMRALHAASPNLADALREAKNLVEALREERPRRLNP